MPAFFPQSEKVTLEQYEVLFMTKLKSISMMIYGLTSRTWTYNHYLAAGPINILKQACCCLFSEIFSA